MNSAVVCWRIIDCWVVLVAHVDIIIIHDALAAPSLVGVVGCGSAG